MLCADQTDHVRHLLAFLEPVVSLRTFPDRFDAYQETWVRLNPAAAEEIWQTDSVNFPWSSGKVDLWRTLRCDIERKFQTALNEHLKGEFTNRPIVDFSFMHYSEMLLELLDKFLQGLDKYIAIQDHITAVRANMDAYGEDELSMSEENMHGSARRRAQDFLDVILFMHAVPQRVDGRWDVLDHESDVTWFREYCEVYQKNEELMTFLRDCAVAVLVVGDFYVTPLVILINCCYKDLLHRQLRENN
jgi:hypothetical protein